MNREDERKSLRRQSYWLSGIAWFGVAAIVIVCFAVSKVAGLIVLSFVIGAEIFRKVDVFFFEFLRKVDSLDNGD